MPDLDAPPPNTLTEQQMLESNTYEAHVWHAGRAIARDEISLAMAHLRLANELQDAIAHRAERFQVEQAGKAAWRDATPEARAQAINALSNLALVPVVGSTRDEQPICECDDCQPDRSAHRRAKIIALDIRARTEHERTSGS